MVQNTAPEGCRYCIDKITNMTIQNMADILAVDPNTTFQKANVIQGGDTQIGEEKEKVINIKLNPKDNKSFSDDNVVSF